MESYTNLNEMYQDLGLMPKMRILYFLPGEIKSSETIARPVKFGSLYAEGMSDDAVNIGVGLVDRCVFHGKGTVTIEAVELVEV